MSEKSMNEKNERNLDSTVDEIMEEIREQTVSEVKDINEKEQKSEERPRKKKVTKTKRPSGHHVSGDGVDHKAASDKDRPVKKKAPRRKKKVVREETGLLDLEGAEEWRDEEETAVPPAATMPPIGNMFPNQCMAPVTFSPAYSPVLWSAGHRSNRLFPLRSTLQPTPFRQPCRICGHFPAKKHRGMVWNLKLASEIL